MFTLWALAAAAAVQDLAPTVRAAAAEVQLHKAPFT
jgi:hypothetical protein